MLNTRKPAQGVQVLRTAGNWDALVAALPKGGCTDITNDALDQMVEDSVFSLADAMTLFEVRFGHKALDVSSNWTADNLKLTWRALSELPVKDVTLNNAITTFTAVAGGGGTYSGSVNIGQDTGGDSEYLEHTVRHEVGHGVHEQIKDEVNPWLQNDM